MNMYTMQNDENIKFVYAQYLETLFLDSKFEKCQKERVKNTKV